MWRYLLPPLLALGLGALRWWQQGRGNVYTALRTRYYAPDPDLGWRLVDSGPPALGLEVLGVLAGVVVATLVAALILRRLERRAGRPLGVLRVALQVLTLLPLAVPAFAFARGWWPAGARETPPDNVVEAPAGVLEGGLPGLPSGRWVVVPHAASHVVAALDAGGEAFEARFARVVGAVRFDPADLRQPMSAELEIAATDVDTGIDMRTKHAREEYLLGEKYPRITFALKRLVGAQPGKAGEINFRAEGELGLIGKVHKVDVTGTLRAPDEAARGRLGLGAEPTLLATASFAVPILETALAPDRGDFDKDTIPIRVSLVLRYVAAR